jgi:hypothetical protein
MDTAAELPPGCLVVLIRLSADMAADVPTPRGEFPAATAARFLADALIEWLVDTAAQYPIDLAVLGYRTGPDQTLQLFSLLPTEDPSARFLPLTHVARLPAEPRGGEGLPKKWTVLPPSDGEPCSADALARVYQMIGVWLTGRFSARPPVVVHCTGADALDEAYFRVARSLGLLATGYGPTRLLHHVFVAGADPVPVGAWTTAPDDELWAQLFESSAELPELADGSKPARRALAVNDWDIADHWSAVFDSAWRGDEIEWVGSGGFSNERAMWAQKMGNSPEQWEDAFAVDAPGGSAAIADGASSGIYCNIWADQLSKRFLTDRPDTRDPVSLNKWVNGLRSEWRTAIKYSSLNWSKQAKVDQTGAAATFLTLEIGPSDASGCRPWRACAVGDATLFWVRNGRLVATFPVVAADQFGSAPLLVRSNPGFKTLVLAAAGVCRPGDRFVLATDAVSARLFKSAEGGPGPEWGRFESITQDEWREELDALRRANDMVNDDCTLVVLRVAGGSEEPAEPVEGLPEAAEIDESEAPAGLPAESGDHPAEVHDAGEGPSGHEAPKNQPTGAPAPDQESVIGADVGDLMLDIPPAPPAGESAERPELRDEPPPVDPPAARDGFPESTDTRD